MAFRTAEQIKADAGARLDGDAGEAVVDHARRSDQTRKRVVITLDAKPEFVYPQGGQRKLKIGGREAGRDNSLSAVYEPAGHENRGGFGFEELSDRIDGLNAGDKVTLAGSWTKRNWNARDGSVKSSWEFKTQRFERGDVTIEAMERSALARIEVGTKGKSSSPVESERSVSARTDESLADFGLEAKASVAPDVRDRQRAAFGQTAGQSQSRRWSEDELVAMVPALLAKGDGYQPYAGIGSRDTTQEVCDDMTAIARVLEARGMTLRSGFAGGADTAFELGTTRDDRREIFAPWKGFGSNPQSKHEEKRWNQIRRHEGITGEPFTPAKATMLEGPMVRKSEELAAPHHPNWSNLPDGHRKLHSRNMGQVLGPKLDMPSRFEMAFTVDGKASGGTGQAIRVAEASGIPVLNLHNPRIRAAVLSELGLGAERNLDMDMAAARAARDGWDRPVSSGVTSLDVSSVPVRDPGAFDLKAPQSRFIPNESAAPFCKVKDENGLYSNMANGAPFVHDSVTWRSTEAFYQAARFPHLPNVQKEIWEATNAYAAKIKAYEYITESRKDWSDPLPGGGMVKDQVMAFAVTQKLQDRAFSEIVERNRDKEVVEISSRDQYWGAAKVEGGYRGSNQLGSLLTQLSHGARMHDLPPGTTFPSREFMMGVEAAPAKAQAQSRAPRSVSYEEGSIVDHKADVLVNTVNCQLSEFGNGVMGAGVAKAFKEAYPSIMKDYTAAIRSGDMKPGRALLFDLPDGRKWAALGTKDHFKDPSRMEWVEAGLKELGEKVRAAGLTSVAIPPPGCGNGKLDWKKVEPLVHRELSGLDVAIYARPSGAVPSNDVGTEAVRSSPITVRLPEPTLKASMYFSYDGAKRPEVTSDTTFDAIKAGERTSTTRFPEWGGYDRWKTLSPGDVVRMYADREMRGEKVDVVVLGVKEVDLSKMAPSQMEQWSKAEGWSEEAGRKFGRQHGVGLQIRYDLPEKVDADRIARAREEQREADREPSLRKAPEPVAMDADAIRRAKQRAALGRGLGG